MQGNQTAPEGLIVVDIKLNRGLVVVFSCALVLALLLVFLALTGGSASASETEAAQPASTSMRQFYVTEGWFVGDDALNACGAGYQMASFWEIADTSNLRYNTDPGKYIAR